MALREPHRTSIQERFVELLGPDEAAALMDQFPATDLGDTVTREILDLRLRDTESRLRTEIAEVRTEIAEVRTEIAEGAGKVEARLAALDTRMTDLPDLVIKQLLFWLVPVLLTAIGISVALARLVS
ncbi:MAG: hypothetical protein R2726_06605 [Acidimicrobiales bacterium]